MRCGRQVWLRTEATGSCDQLLRSSAGRATHADGPTGRVIDAPSRVSPRGCTERRRQEPSSRKATGSGAWNTIEVDSFVDRLRHIVLFRRMVVGPLHPHPIMFRLKELEDGVHGAS